MIVDTMISPQDNAKGAGEPTALYIAYYFTQPAPPLPSPRQRSSPCTITNTHSSLVLIAWTSRHKVANGSAPCGGRQQVASGSVGVACKGEAVDAVHRRGGLCQLKNVTVVECESHVNRNILRRDGRELDAVEQHTGD